jgi:phospholipid transport system substrate-binding protein
MKHLNLLLSAARLLWLLPVLALGAGGAARAADAPAEPDAMILHLSEGVLDALRADKAIQAGDFARVQKLVDEKVMPSLDFDKMTRLAVGRAWRGATPEQRKALTDQFRTLLLRTYSGALARVTDHRVRLRPSRGGADAGGDVIVRTQVVPGQGEPIDLDYRLERVDAGWRIYDFNVMGVWLVENYKTEFASALSQGGLDALIQSLTDKNQRLASRGRAS